MGLTLGEDLEGSSPLFVRAGPVCVFVFTSLPKAHEVAVSAPACASRRGAP